MKKIILYSLIALLALSCTTWTAPYFTNVEKLSQLKKGMEVETVNEVLGIAPYDLYVTQEEGVSVVIYHYRTKKRRMKLSANAQEAEAQKFGGQDGQVAGREWYDKDEKKVFVVFEDGKLNSFLTEKGRADGELLLMVDNNLKYVTKEEFQTIQMDPSRNMLIISDKNEKSGKKGFFAKSNDNKSKKAKDSKGEKKKKKKVGIIILVVVGVIVVANVAIRIFAAPTI